MTETTSKIIVVSDDESSVSKIWYDTAPRNDKEKKLYHWISDHILGHDQTLFPELKTLFVTLNLCRYGVTEEDSMPCLRFATVGHFLTAERRTITERIQKLYDGMGTQSKFGVWFGSHAGQCSNSLID
jgi:hypothetical protein